MIYCGMCNDTGLQNGGKCPQPGCRKANGLPPFDAPQDRLVLIETFAGYTPFEASTAAVKWINGNTREESRAERVISVCTFHVGTEYFTQVWYYSS